MNAGKKSASSAGKSSATSLDAGFAVIRGENWSYVVQDLRIVVGRSTKNKGKVHLDLTAKVRGAKNISPHHARMFYDFQKHHFSLEVLGRNGCTVQGVLYLPGRDPIKLKSQDLIQIADIKFYFLLPSRSISDSFSAWHAETLSQSLSSSPVSPPYPSSIKFREYTFIIASPKDDTQHTQDLHGKSCGHGRVNGDHGITVGTETQGTSMGQNKRSSDELDMYCSPINVEPLGEQAQKDVPEADKDTDNNEQLGVTDETDLISYVITLVADNCKQAGEWMPMEKLHAKLIEHFSKICPQWMVQKYLAPEDGSSTGTLGKPWKNLLELLLKHPEHFDTSTIRRDTTTSEFVSLASMRV
ncbi:hypothetical protein BRADI_2g18190v3 [Brachypodium distachyon]|uniref:FHA domain-containing protein n=1 Tax=Brachypodium distachyon TaxID=15368 RepID=A0A0Q3G0U6_BRADI|nr:hypothetical protein BRADI_2g18190v3 [Brachypodium distachyon]